MNNAKRLKYICENADSVQRIEIETLVKEIDELGEINDKIYAQLDGTFYPARIVSHGRPKLIHITWIKVVHELPRVYVITTSNDLKISGSFRQLTELALEKQPFYCLQSLRKLKQTLDEYQHGLFNWCTQWERYRTVVHAPFATVFEKYTTNPANNFFEGTITLDKTPRANALKITCCVLLHSEITSPAEPIVSEKLLRKVFPAKVSNGKKKVDDLNLCVVGKSKEILGLYQIWNNTTLVEITNTGAGVTYTLSKIIPESNFQDLRLHLPHICNTNTIDWSRVCKALIIPAE